jgi:glycosyltransferase involved in cell wall biosynthesis
MECSVLLTVYNGAATLAETIASILNQTEKDFEFLIIDDGSKDHTPEIIRKYAKKDSRIRPVIHTDNAGLSARLNEGLLLAQTDLVARIDHDDIALPKRLELQIRFMRTRPDVAAAGSFVYHMGRTVLRDRLVRLPVEHDEIVNVLPNQNCMYHPAMMLRRNAVLLAGSYRREFRHSEDYDLWLRLSKKHKLANLQIPLLRYRFSPGGESLARKWYQMRYALMAQLSYRDSTLEGTHLENAADAALAQIDKADYFDVVARGTIAEMIRLGDYFGAFKVLKVFSNNVTGEHASQLLKYTMRTAINEGVGRVIITGK